MAKEYIKHNNEYFVIENANLDINRLNNLKNHIESIPSCLAGRPYMAYYIQEVCEQYPEMGFIKGVKLPKFKNIVKDIGKFLSKTVNDLGKVAENIAREATVFVNNVGNVTEKAMRDAKQVVMDTLPPFMRPYVGIAIAPFEFIFNPKATIDNISKDFTNIAKDFTNAFGAEKIAEIGNRKSDNKKLSKPREAWKDPYIPVLNRNIKFIGDDLLPLVPASILEHLNKFEDVTTDVEIAGRKKIEVSDVLSLMLESIKNDTIPGVIPSEYSNAEISISLIDDTIRKYYALMIPQFDALVLKHQPTIDDYKKIYDSRTVDWNKLIFIDYGQLAKVPDQALPATYKDPIGSDQQKKSAAPGILLGLLGLAALGYMASQDE